MIIFPVLNVLKVSTQIKSEARAIYEGSYNGQNLMKQVKEAIAVYLDYDKKNSYLPEKDKKYQESIQMLLEGTESEREGIDFIRLEEENEKVYAKYQMDKYFYEVGIWPIGEKNQATWLSIPLEVDKAYSYKLKTLAGQKNFEMNLLGEGVQIEQLPTMPNAVKGHFFITWIREKDILKNSLKEMSENCLVKAVQEGESYYILTSDEKIKEGEIKVVIDLTPLEELVEEGKESIQFKPIVIENRTNLSLTLNFIHLEGLTKEKAEILSHKWVEVINQNPTSWMNEVYDIPISARSFQIILLVRQKGTSLGEPGKVIKTIVDVYSPYKR